MNISTDGLIKKSMSGNKLSETFLGLGDRYFYKLKGSRDKIFQVDAINGVTETAGSILNRSILIAMALQKRRVLEGDRIIMCSKMNLDLTPTILGIWYIGAIACPLDPNMDIEESARFIHILRPKIAFVDLRAQGYVELALRGGKITNCEIILFGQSTAYTAGTDKIFAVKATDSNFLPIQISKPKLKSAFIAPSEGTTRQPKLVDISHYAVLCRCVSFEIHIGQKIDRVLCFYPFATFPNLVTTCSSLEDGNVKIIPGPFSAKYAARLIHDLKVDLAIMGTDLGLRIASYIRFTKDFDLSSLKGLVVGLMATNAKDMAMIKTIFPGTIVMNVYGCMECGYISGGAAPLNNEILSYTLTMQASRLSSVGRAFRKVKYKIVDQITQEPVKKDVWGEMLVRGPGIMLGYYGDQLASANAFLNGYYKTGDIVQFDEEDFLYIRGRIYDQLLKDGISYPASELEEIVLMHAEVEEVAVVCSQAGNIAYVVLSDAKSKLKAEELKAYVAELTPEFKRLTMVHFVDTLPKTAFGKVQKYKLKCVKMMEMSQSSLAEYFILEDQINLNNKQRIKNT